MKLQDLKTLSKEKSISVFTFRKFVKMGLPHFRIGRKILVNPEEFDTWFESAVQDIINITISRLLTRWFKIPWLN